jgi:anti-sigma factor RsiW
MSRCRELAPWIDVLNDRHGDGRELISAERRIELEQHLGECRVCASRLRLNDAVRVSLQRATRPPIEQDDALRARIAAALAAERAREEQTLHQRRDRMLPWRTILPVAAAAGATLVWAASAGESRREPLALASTNAAGDIAASADQLIDDLLAWHAAPPKPRVVEPSLAKALEPEVGVPVRVPSLHQYGARWEGASVVPIRRQRAASFRYDVAGHHVTVYVYDARRVPLRTSLEPRVVRNVPVFVGNRRGYSIAAVEQRGVGQALATDLDSAEAAELVAMATLH